MDGLNRERLTEAVFQFTIPAHLWTSLNRPKGRYGHSARTVRELHAITPAEVPKLAPRQVLRWQVAYPKGVGPKADPTNAAPVTKAILDGMVRGGDGILPDDCWLYVASETFERVPNLPEKGIHRITLICQEEA